MPPVTWAIVTSGSSAVAGVRIRHAAPPVPAVLVTADDVENGKLSPEPYLAAADALGCHRSDVRSLRRSGRDRFGDGGWHAVDWGSRQR